MVVNLAVSAKPLVSSVCRVSFQILWQVGLLFWYLRWMDASILEYQEGMVWGFPKHGGSSH